MDKQTVRQVVLKQIEDTSGIDQTTIKDNMNLESDCRIDSIDGMF